MFDLGCRSVSPAVRVLEASAAGCRCFATRRERSANANANTNTNANANANANAERVRASSADMRNAHMRSDGNLLHDESQRRRASSRRTTFDVHVLGNAPRRAVGLQRRDQPPSDVRLARAVSGSANVDVDDREAPNRNINGFRVHGRTRHHRSDANAALSSLAKSSGRSHAAKWPPSSTRL